MSDWDLDAIRALFPAMMREQDGERVAYFDGPAGSQVPGRVMLAISRYLVSTNANHGAPFATSRESDALLEQAHQSVADFLGASDSDCIAFGANMTTLTFALSRALGRTWNAGDEVIVTDLDHDANVTPWVLAAEDVGAVVHRVPIRPEDCTLDLETYNSKLSEKTRLVAVGYASNATGTVNPVGEMIQSAHQVGAEVFVDAVHLAPHRLIDVTTLDCDYLAASAYKFFGPHVGMMFGKRERLESLTPYKLRPATNTLPGKWMTGTQNHEGIMGVNEAIHYLADLSGKAAESKTLRERLVRAFEKIRQHEDSLCTRLLTGLAELPAFRIWGISDPSRMEERVPTVSITHETKTPQQLAEALSARGLYCWPGNHYALPFTEAMGLEPGGTLRIGLLHYNSEAEIDHLLTALAELV